MLFKRCFLFALLLSFSCYCKGQDNFKLNLRIARGRAFVSSIHFIDNNLTVYIDRAGGLVLGYDGENNDLADDDNRDVLPALDYYGTGDWDELKGKIKQIGNLPVTYYDRFDWDELRGKVKSIGNVKFTYYDRFGWDELQGKIKTIGNTTITYYDRFGPTERMGYVKNVESSTPGLNIIWRKNPYVD